MNEEQKIKQISFQHNFQELAFARDMSHCSFFSNCEMNLDLEIEDVVELDDLELNNYQLSFFNKDPSLIFEENQEVPLEEQISVNVEIEKQSLKINSNVSMKESESEEPILVIPKKIKKTQKSGKSKSKAPKTFYEKNICRNITRKIIRMIESETYAEKLLEFCGNDGQFYKQFSKMMLSHLQTISGPSALKEFLLVDDQISQVFKIFSRWYLKERYIRDALNGGHMNNVEKYISFKNQVLLPLIDRL